MELEEMKKKVKIWFNDIYGKRDFSQLEDVVAMDYRDGPNHEGIRGPEFIKERYAKMESVVGDLQIDIVDLIAEGNKVVAHYRMRAKHIGPFLGIEATGREFVQEGMTILTFNRDLKVYYTYGVYDRQKIIQQLTE